VKGGLEFATGGGKADDSVTLKGAAATAVGELLLPSVAVAEEATPATAAAACVANQFALKLLAGVEGELGHHDAMVYKGALKSRWQNPHGIALSQNEEMVYVFMFSASAFRLRMTHLRLNSASRILIRYVVDSGNHCVRCVSNIDGSVSTVAGVPGMCGYCDGRGGTALFCSPTGIAIDHRQGDIYVTDTGNHCVRRISEPGRTAACR
jgi:DNA-binding beta-propeller fold protein YncE